MDRRTVILSGEINDESISEVIQRLLVLQMNSHDRINLLINSGGGDTGASLRLCDLVSTFLTAPVRGIAFGECASAATFVMLHCHERVSTPYAQFLIHSGTRSEISLPINQTTSENIELLLKEVRASEAAIERLYMDRLTPLAWQDKEVSDEERRSFVRGLINRGDQRFDEWIIAEEAMEAGLITKIITDKLEIFPE